MGDVGKAEEIATYLRRCGYSESNSSRLGWYKVRPDGIEINPGPDSFTDEGAVVKMEKRQASRRSSPCATIPRAIEYLLEPELISNLFDAKREKRRIVRFANIPQVHGGCGTFRRRQTFLSARRASIPLELSAPSGSICGGQQSPGCFHVDAAAWRARCLTWVRSAAGGGRFRKR